MRNVLLLLASSILACEIAAQPITWTQQPMASLPPGVQLYRGERASPALRAWYLRVNMNDTTIAIRPYITSNPEGVVPFTSRVKAYAAINGGFFGGSTSASAVIYPNEVRAQNVQVLNRSGTLYPATRSLFSVSTRREMAVNWIWHFGSRVSDIFRFDPPTPNVPGTPAPTPDSANGTRFPRLLVGIGGAPTLVKNGQVNVTYNQEVMFGSGVGLDNQDPRTAVGYTPDGHAILLVADGRGALSSGVNLTELAQIMIDRGCVEAMNLDGGGSTSMAVGDSLINRPSDGTQRSIPTILAVVRAESLQVPREPVFEKIIDTGDMGATLVSPANGWFASANPGYWGTTPAMLHPVGNGTAYARFKTGTTVNALYEVYGWWVASSNRATDVPFVIKHATGQDTVRVSQAANGSQWVRIGGTYRFSNDTSHAVFVSNAAATNNFVVADAIRIISYDQSTASVREIGDGIPEDFSLEQNYPNPFNPQTTIRFSLGKAGFVTLKLYDMLGREVRTLVSRELGAGKYETSFEGEGLASGVYVYRLATNNGLAASRKLTLLR